MSSSRVDQEKFLIPLEEILRATKNFSPENMIGKGGFGPVYRGQLSERWQNCTAAVKRLDPTGFQGKVEFHNELDIISILHHENIIGFIGYCDENKEMIVVYEYSVKGDLARCLQNPDEMRCITWKQRLNICLGAAKGIKYLHSGIEGGIIVIHGDVKSANILLDDNMNAKITDFGMSSLHAPNQPTYLLTDPRGTHRYIDPFFMTDNILSKASDVYTLGVVIFEMLCGMLAYYQRRNGDDEPLYLIDFVQRYTELDKIIDPCMRGQIDRDSATMIQKIAYKCIRLEPNERPTIDRIINKIQKAIKSEDDYRPHEHPISFSGHYPLARNNDIRHEPPISATKFQSNWAKEKLGLP